MPTTLAAPTFGFYQDANVTLFTSGVTVTADFNSTTGLNHLQMIVTTSATGIVAGSAYQLVIATGSVSGVSMKGYVIGEFSVLRTTALRPTTAGNTLDVNSNGEAGLDWGNIGNQGTTNSFTATTLFTATNVTNNVGAIVTSVNTIVPARITAQGIDVGAIVTSFNTIAPANVTSISTVVNANVTAFSTILAARITAQGIDIGAIVTAVSTIVPARITAQGIDVGAIVTSFNTIAPANVTAYSTVLSVNITASSTVLTAAVTVVNASGQKQIENAVWDALATDHNTALTLGNKLNSAASAGDPWTTALPGAYGAGTAGNIIGNRVDASVGSRMATYTQPSGFLAATFPTGTIANTTNITAGTITTATNLTTNNDKTGYSLTQAFPTNFSATEISVLGIVSADAKLMASATVKGSGTATNLWRGA